MKHFVTIAGNIGAGKSSLTQMLSHALNWEAFFEAAEDNPYLADFYQDMRRWSFNSQVFFLSRRLRHHRFLLERPHSVIQDRSIYEDAEVCARNLYLQGDMDPRDNGCYRELYEALTAILPPPDLVVYLRASVSTLMHRIARRGRDFEKGISPDYVARLNTLYEAWIADYALCPVLTVPADELDFVAHPAHLALIAEKVQAKLRGEQLVLF